MGLDLGDSRIGVALSDPTGTIAGALTTLQRKNPDQDIAELGKLAAEHAVSKLIIGLPINMDGSLGPQAKKTQAFAERAGAALGIPVEFWDERLSSRAVESVLIEAGMSRQKRKGVIDKVAAVYILQGYLDSRPHSERAL